jgi:hypothetical protein
VDPPGVDAADSVQNAVIAFGPDNAVVVRDEFIRFHVGVEAGTS